VSLELSENNSVCKRWNNYTCDRVWWWWKTCL